MPPSRAKSPPAKPSETRTASPRKPSAKTTINEIARLAGVSKKTVSRIINNSPLVREETRLKVKALMKAVEEGRPIPPPKPKATAAGE